MVKIKIREYLVYKSREIGEDIIPYKEAIEMIRMLKREIKINQSIIDNIPKILGSE